MINDFSIEDTVEIDDDFDDSDDDYDDDETDEINLYYESSIGRDSRSRAFVILAPLSDYSDDLHTSTILREIGRLRAGYGRNMNVFFALFTQRVGCMKKFMICMIISFIIGFVSVLLVYVLPKRKIVTVEEPSFCVTFENGVAE